MKSQRLTFFQQLAYALPALPLTAAGVSVYIFITRFYTDAIQLNLTVIGAIVLGSRIWDAVIDPTIGSLADRTRSKYGRRKLWLAISLIPFSLSTLALFSPPLSLSETGKGIWFGTFTFLFFLFLSTAQIPYEALGAELSKDYDERNKLFGIRQAFFIIGTVLAAALPGILISQFSFSESLVDQAKLYHIVGIVYALLTVASVAVLLYAVSENPLKEDTKKHSIFSDAKSALKSKPFRILIIAYVLSGFGSALPATLIEFYVRYVLKAESSSPFLVLYFAVGLVTLPAWVWLATRFDKKNTWILSLIINVGAFAGVYFLPVGSQTLYSVLIIISGLGFGGTVTIPLSMQADVIEDDARRHGTRREGTFVGLWSIASKLSAALGAGIAFPILDQVGYVPNANQTPQTVYALRALYAGLPSLCYLISMFVILSYPLTRKDFTEHH